MDALGCTFIQLQCRQEGLNSSDSLKAYIQLSLVNKLIYILQQTHSFYFTNSVKLFFQIAYYITRTIFHVAFLSLIIQTLSVLVLTFIPQFQSFK